MAVVKLARRGAASRRRSADPGCRAARRASGTTRSWSSSVIRLLKISCDALLRHVVGADARVEVVGTAGARRRRGRSGSASGDAGSADGAAASATQRQATPRTRVADTPARPHQPSRFLLQLRQQRQRFDRRHAIDVERRQLLRAGASSAGGAWNSPSWRCGSDGVPLTDGRPPRVSSSRSSAVEDLAGAVDDRRRQPGEPRHLDAVAAVGSARARSCAGR